MSDFNEDSNEMNINAILHGIKNEVADDDLFLEEDQTIEDDIFGNNEVANDDVHSHDDLNYSILENNITSIPIVYTTRLDEMNIFDKIEKYTPTEAAVLIQYESKPQYKQKLPIKRDHCDYHSYSYMKLYGDIERLNQKVQMETKLRNEELMSMCKPLKIVLIDLKYDKVKTTDSESTNLNPINRKPRSTPGIKKIKANPKMVNKEVVKSVAQFQNRTFIKINDSDDSDSSDDMPLKILQPGINKPAHLVLPGPKTIAFIDKTTRKVNVYITNHNKDLCGSYQLDLKEFYSMKKRNPAKITVVYDVCCWVKREKQIELLFHLNVANDIAITFMRIPHGCLTSSCTCCCNLERPMPLQSSVTFLKITNKKSEISTKASELIQKAYSYRTKSQSSKISAVDEPISFLKNAVIMMKYKAIIFSQSFELGENYEIGMGGDIDNHVELTVNRSITEERELHEEQDRENKISRQYFSYLICCWNMREEIIVNLCKDHNLSPRACKYLRNPHLCKSHKCQCCCKAAKSGLLVDHTNIATPMQTHRNRNSKEFREDKKKYQTAMDKTQADKTKKICIDNKKYKRKAVAPANTVAEEVKTTKKQIPATELVGQCKPDTVKSISQTIVEPSNESQPNVAKTIEAPTAPPELISGIFDKFKDLKLSVNAKGTLTANINTPPEQLSTVEIRVLADVLAQATNQMYELGMGPEEFCRQLNSKSLLLNAVPSMDILSKAQPTSSLPRQSISPPPLCPIAKKTIQNTKDVQTTEDVQPPQSGKQKPPPCKTNKISINFPKTTNSSRISNLYSMMSHTGWNRNKSMIASYKIHFGIFMDKEPEPQLSKTQITNIEEQPLPKIVNVQSLVDTAPTTEMKSNKPIRKRKQANKPQPKGVRSKIRVLPPERITTLPVNNQMNVTGSGNLATLTKNISKPIEPMPGHSQENMRGTKSSLVSNVPIQDISNASSLPNAGLNNGVLAQGINSGAPTTNIPESPKIWAYIDGKLVELQCVTPLPNAASQNNPALHQNYGFPKTVNQTPVLTVINGVPVQVSRLCTDSEHEELRSIDKDVKAPTENVETEDSAMNTLLRHMLTKESPLPNLPQRSEQNNTKGLKRTVTPLIAHSKELGLKKRRVLNDPIVSNTTSKENVQNAIIESTINLIDSDEDEEGIFGV